MEVAIQTNNFGIHAKVRDDIGILIKNIKTIRPTIKSNGLEFIGLDTCGELTPSSGNFWLYYDCISSKLHLIVNIIDDGLVTKMQGEVIEIVITNDDFELSKEEKKIEF